MEKKSTTIKCTPKITGLDELKACAEKLEELSSELTEALDQISETNITIEMYFSQESG